MDTTKTYKKDMKKESRRSFKLRDSVKRRDLRRKDEYRLAAYWNYWCRFLTEFTRRCQKVEISWQGNCINW